MPPKTRGSSRAGTVPSSPAPEKAGAAAAASSSSSSSSGGIAPKVPSSVATGIQLAVFTMALYFSVQIRLFAVNVYGRVIHEFDPWFNFRATQYLVDNGWEAFSTWYDYESWYPLGRPVGTTIYPGMQLTAAWIYYTLNAFGFEVSLNDVCVFIPAGFATITCTFVYLLTKEVSRSRSAAVAATAVMAILPAHLMRSVAGGYDNESVAVAAICATFFFWVRSLRGGSSWLWGIATGVSYTYMVAAWGGYVFVLNMIGVHAGVLLLMGRFNSTLHLAYSLFYVIGTAGALQFPIVGLQPLQSMEQLGPMGVFLGFQLWAALEHYRVAAQMDAKTFFYFRIQALAGAAIALLVVLFLVLPEGFFGPLSARVRGLFVAHTRTGNPLVDSVAEHQATPMEVYFRYFHIMHYLAPFGVAILLWKRTTAGVFMILFYFIAGYFSSKMIRLVLLLSPASAACSGVAIAGILEWSYGQFSGSDDGDDAADAESSSSSSSSSSRRAGKKGRAAAAAAAASEENAVISSIRAEYRKYGPLRKGFAMIFMSVLFMAGLQYVPHSFLMAQQLSHPSIMIQGRARDGSIVMIDDFREAYWWLRDNTPTDSRVMAWWDYGYQIAGIGNRTTIADGNTWNHEHIALLGKCLVSDEVSSHRIVRHLADYVLVWSTRYGGMAGDDLAKMPHMGRIAGSVYSDVPQEGYWQDQHGNPSELMRRSLLYQLHSYRLNPNVPEPSRYEEAFTSKNNMVRIFKVKNISQESKEWCAANPGQYPPALKPVVAKKKDFKQIHSV